MIKTFDVAFLRPFVWGDPYNSEPNPSRPESIPIPSHAFVALRTAVCRPTKRDGSRNKAPCAILATPAAPRLNVTLGRGSSTRSTRVQVLPDAKARRRIYFAWA